MSRMKKGCLTAIGCLGVFAVGSSVALLAGSFAAGLAWNGSTIDLPEPSEGWVVTSSQGTGDAQAAETLRNAVIERCALSNNGLRVLYNQIWYNALTSGYTETLRVRDESRGRSQFTVYGWSDHAVLRRSVPPYGSQVIHCDLEAQDWATLIMP